MNICEKFGLIITMLGILCFSSGQQKDNFMDFCVGLITLVGGTILFFIGDTIL